MTEMKNGIVGILRHNLTGAEFGADLGEQIPGRCVVVSEVSSNSLNHHKQRQSWNNG